MAEIFLNVVEEITVANHITVNPAETEYKHEIVKATRPKNVLPNSPKLNDH